MIRIPGVLDAKAVEHCRRLMAEAEWVDGNETSGAQSALAKRNHQLPENSAEAREMGRMILDALAHSPLCIAAALPLKVFPPLFNRYEGGDAFGTPVGNAIRLQPGADLRIRRALRATMFPGAPD